MHPLQNFAESTTKTLCRLMLIEESKTSFDYLRLAVIKEKNSLILLLVMLSILTQERNMSGSKKIGPGTSQRSLWRYTLHYLVVSSNEIQKDLSKKKKSVRYLTIN